MKNKSQQIAQDDLEFIYNSESLDYSIAEISKSYSLDKDKIFEYAKAVCDSEFYLEDFEGQLKSFFSLSDDQIKKFTLDFLGKILLPISLLLGQGEVKKEITKRNADISSYQNYIDIFNSKMQLHGLSESDKILEDYEKKINHNNETLSTLDIFKNDLADIFKLSSNQIISELNTGLIYQLKNKSGFKEQLLRVMLNNDEKLTNSVIMLNNSRQAPTISNWLKDFIAKNPAGMDNIALSNYLVNSKNASLLDDKEKKLLSKLLQLYRNIKGFPQLFLNIPMEQWQIIPIEFSPEKNQSAKPIENKLPNLPFTKKQMREMTAIEKMIAIQEYGLSEEEWGKMIS